MNLLVNGYTIFAIAILLLALAIVWMGVKVAPQGPTGLSNDLDGTRAP